MAFATPSKFTQAEQDWLVKNPIVTVAISSDYAPISYLSEKNKFTGISADYLALIEQQLKAVNPNFNFVTVLPNKVERGANDPLHKHVSMVVDFVITPDRQKYWQFTKPYLEMPLHLIVRQDVTFNISLSQFKQEKIAVIDYYAAHELLAKNILN